MSYTRVNWENAPSTATPRSATNLNVMDAGIKSAHDRLDAIGGASLTYTWSENIDATNNAELDFVLPAGVTSVISARLIVRGKAARDITSVTAAASGNTGSASSSTSTESNHTHNLNYTTANTQTEQGHFHQHTIASSAAAGGAHSHSVDSHAHTLGSHTHTLTKAVNVSTTPDGVNVFLDNGAGYGGAIATGSAPVLIDADITASITATTALKQIRVTSTRLGKVDVILAIVAS